MEDWVVTQAVFFGVKILCPLKAHGEMGICLLFKLERYRLYAVYALYSPRAIAI